MTDHPTDDPVAERQVRDAIRALADSGGAPDEPAAWERVRTGIDRDRRRRRASVALASVAAVAAVVVGVLALTGDDDREVVDIGPVATDTTVEEPPASAPTPSTTETTDPAAAFPTRPLAVVVSVDGEQRLDLYDGDTGELVSQGLASSVHSISDVSFGADGAVWFTEELGDSSAIRMVPWDGSGPPTTPFDVGDETRSPALSPDGTLAYVHQGVTIGGAEIVLVDTTTGGRRSLRWAPDEDDFFRLGGQLEGLEWSPSGDRLLFVLGYEGYEPLLLDAEATTLSEAVPADDLSAYDVHWSGADELIGMHDCCYPEFDEPQELRRVALGEGVTTIPVDGEIVAFDVHGDGTIAAVRADGSVARIGPDGTVSDVAIEGSAVDVGL